MGKKIITFLMLLTLLISIPKVYAEDEEQPIERTAGNYKFIIEKFAIKLYPYVLSDEESSKEAYEKYQQGIYSKEIDIPLSEVTMTPSTSFKKNDSFGMQVVDLKTNFTKEKIYDYIKDEIDDVSEEKKYEAELVIYYKVTKVPDGYNKYFQINTFRGCLYIINKIFGESYDFADPVEEVELNETVSQVLNFIEITEEDGVKYHKTVEESDPVLFMNYFALSKVEESDEPTESTDSEESDDENEADNSEPNIDEVLIFMNVSDPEVLISKILEQEDPTTPVDPTNPTNPLNPLSAVAEPIPNTAMNKSQIILLIGLILITLGTGIISKTVHKKG